jgi:V8-like Glu-specific endopeptidase
MPAGALDNPVRVELTQQDLDDLAVRTVPLRIGVVKSIRPVNVAGLGHGQAGGVFEETQAGGFTWAITISSPGAEGIRVHVRNFSLPDGATMYIFSPDGSAQGPYEGVGRNGDGDFWTHTVFSETAVIQVRHDGPATAQDKANVRFVIDSVGHIRPDRPQPVQQDWGQDRCGNEDCVLDANCGGVGAAEPDAIAKMEWISGAYIITCTGGLIADTDNSTQRNLFLTANHCISKSRDAANMETYFSYTTSSCNGECPPWPSTPHTIGATLLATSRDGDFTLLELNEDPPSGTTFLGWNNSPIADTNGADLYRVSNPNYGPQVYSHHEVNATTETCRGLPRGEFIYSDDVEGATDGGSSGSPVVNSSGEIVGQLYGCCGYDCGDVCAGPPTNSTVDGALAFYYANVAEFLDPDGGGGCTTPADCDDSEPCTDDTCVDGTCYNTWPDCGLSDGCCGPECSSANDPDCVECLLKGEPCTTGEECCSGLCHPVKGTCK